MAKKYKYTTTFTYEGKRYKVRADNPVDLEVKKKMKLQSLIAGKYVLSSDMPLSQWAEHCISLYKPNQKEITREKYVSMMNCAILKHIGHMKLKKITTMHCQEIINMQIGNSESQIRQVCQIMNFLFSKAVKEKMIYENPAESIVRPKGTVRHNRTITDNEREHILRIIPTDERFKLYLLMLGCGCRPAEAAICKGSDIQTIMDNQNTEFNVLHIRGQKSKNADRFVPIPDYVYDQIKNTKPDTLIAHTSTGGEIKYNYRSKVWKRFRRELNISMGCKMYRNELVPPFPLAEDLTPYCLRHTYCTDLMKSGVDVRTAQYLMGHSDIRLTANIYTHVDNSSIITAAEAINRGPAVAVFHWANLHQPL